MRPELQVLSALPTMLRLAGRFFPWPFIIAGGVMLVLGARDLEHGWRSAEWPGVEGKITESRVARHSHAGAQGGRRTSYSAEVKYTYEVAGQRFEADRIRFGKISSHNKAAATAEAGRHPAGATVKVFHHPADPAMSVLEPGVSPGGWLLPGLGAVFFGVGTVMSFVLPRFFRRGLSMLSRSHEQTVEQPRGPGAV